MSAEDWIRLFNTALNLLVIPVIWHLAGIKAELARLNERLSGLNRRVEMLEGKVR